MKITLAEGSSEFGAVIKVIGVGGAGGNAINRMAEAGIRGVELIAANSDAQALGGSQAELRIQIGEILTGGLGVGGDAVKGRLAALESEDQIKEVLQGADLAFITTGMGGGTGTGGAPIVAQIAKELGALTIGVVTRPFRYEGLAKMQQAEMGIQEMKKSVDSLLVIPNEKLMEIADRDTSADSAFRMADDVLRKAIQSISDIITIPGIINTDLNDLKAIMKDSGDALIGMGEASGPGRAIIAARMAIESPLLENVVIDGAKGLIVNLTGRKSTLNMHEMDEAARAVTEKASPDAKIKIGKSYEDSLGDRIRVTVIATGFPTARRGLLRQRLTLPKAAAAGIPDGSLVSSAATAEEWAKPAFLRFKPRKLKLRNDAV